MSIRIYTMTHKKFETPPDALYAPLHVGRACAPDLGYPGDDTGDQISAKNCYYSELTGLYWIWKNVSDVDYVGTCHYRRYLINGRGQIFTGAEYEALLTRYDLITTKRVRLNNSYRDGFAANHNLRALDMTGQVIREKYPAYFPAFERLVNGKETYFGNMLVTSKPLFDSYASWLFSIFFEVEKRIELETGEDAYHKRVFGFISEFLLLVWVTVNGLHVFECKVGMLGEKAETRELKQKLAGFFADRDADGAKRCFLTALSLRPDVLMEASDITGELRLSMQVIATAGVEKSCGEPDILTRENDFQTLMNLFEGLNRVTRHYESGEQTKEDIAFLREKPLSDTAIRVAAAILRGSEEDKAALTDRMLADKHQVEMETSG